MTILGALLPGPDHAVIYTDSEMWTNGRITHHAPKLAVNTALCAIGCGTGDGGIINCGDRALRRGINPNKLPDEIGAALRTGVGTHVSKYARRPNASELRVERYYMAMHCPDYGRVLLWEFDYARFFEPVLQNKAFYPEIDAPEEWMPRSQAEIVTTAREQFLSLRRTDPQSGTAGCLCIGEVRRGYVATCAISNFTAPEAPVPPAAPQLEYEEVELCS